MRMKRKALNLLVDEDLVKKARNHGLNLSKFFENQLRSYFEFIEQRQQQYTPVGKYSKTNNQIDTINNINRDSASKDASSGICSVAWISLGLPEPLTRVRIPADPYFYNFSNHK